MSLKIDIPMLHELLVCDASAGRLWWRERGLHWFSAGKHGQAHNAAKWNAKFAGREAFTSASASHGYKAGAIFNKGVLAHRVVFAMATGRWPDVIDHINGDRSDNRISNLRNVSQAENCQNTGPRIKNEINLIGVKQIGDRFGAEIRHKGKSMHIGVYATARDAAIARDLVASRLRGKFARLNFPEVDHA